MREFEHDVIERLTSIETKQDWFKERLDKLDNKTILLGGTVGTISAGVMAIILNLFEVF